MANAFGTVNSQKQKINDIGNFQIPIEQLEKFKEILIEFYESGNDKMIIEFMKENCIRRVS